MLEEWIVRQQYLMAWALPGEEALGGPLTPGRAYSRLQRINIILVCLCVRARVRIVNIYFTKDDCAPS